MASKTSISNLALSHLGSGKLIGNIETEQSQEANAMRAFYDLALKRVIREKKFGFTRKVAALNLIAENPTVDWLYSYRYPSDCVNVWRFSNNYNNWFFADRVPYQVGSDDQGKILYTSQDFATMEYAALITNADIYPPDFELALSFLLAFLTAPRLTGGDPFKLGDRALGAYNSELSKAAVNSYNEEQTPPTPENEYTAARNA